MPKALDLTNQKFGKLIVIKKMPSQGGKTYWLCRCDCGKDTVVQTCHLRSGAIKSCGCLIAKPTHPVVAFRKRIKIALVEAFGHKCACCGLVDNPIIYDFHHLDPKTKEFGIANATTTRSKQAYFKEAKKCIMLCSNCHRKIENNLITLENLQIIAPNEEQYYQTFEDLSK